ncbi:MAG: hypothetical protein ACXACI_05470 [Candidatus Hodarchaeales archaeon]|jgi:hypothetical protein
MKKSFLATVGVLFITIILISANINLCKAYPSDSAAERSKFSPDDGGLAVGTSLSWEITDYNEAFVGQWWNATHFRGVFSVQKGSRLNFTIITPQVWNYTSAYWGALEFGNLSLSVVDNTETGSALTLSIYPWLPGLVTHTNWTWHQQMATTSSASEYLKGTLTTSETIFQLSKEPNSAVERLAIQFDYVQDSPGNQNTTLVYDLETGILLEAQTEFLFGVLYRMGLELREGPAELYNSNRSATNETEDITLEALFLLAGIIIVALNRKLAKGR